MGIWKRVAEGVPEMMSNETKIGDRFLNIYRENEWSNGSGPGSFPQFNEPFLEYLENLISATAISSIVDIGCGDFQLWRGFHFRNCNYLGLDVVEQVVAENQKFATESIKFRVMPSDLNELPEADLYVIKDVLIHLDNAESQRLIAAARRRSAMVLFVNNVDNVESNYNLDIEIGDFRPVDVSRSPFNLKVEHALVYGKASQYDPRWPSPLARLFRRRVWPGVKHVQLVRGEVRERRGDGSGAASV